MILKTHERYILKYFSYNIILVTSIFLVLIFFLNILEEIKFFESRESEIQIAIPLFLTLLNSPSIVFETFPFIFLISTQLLFVSLYDNQEINMLRELLDSSKQELADLLNLIEQHVVWPTQVYINLIVLMGKPTGGSGL